MTKTELKKIMKENGILECELDDVIQFVENLLMFQAMEIERNEPYAIHSIANLREAAHEVWELLEYVEDALEGE